MKIVQYISIFPEKGVKISESNADQFEK